MKLFHVKTLCYDNRIRDIYDLEKYLFPPLMKGESYEEANRKVCDQEFTVSEIRVSTNDGILSSMQYELDDNQEDYLSLAHEDWCDLLSII